MQKPDSIKKISKFITSHKRLLIFLGCCLLFLSVRFIIVFSSVDRIHHVALSEYHMPESARDILITGDFLVGSPGFNHLWGQRSIVIFMVPFVVAGLSDVEVLMFAPLFISFLGFAFLIGMLLRYSSILAALTTTLLMTFAEPNYIKWTLTIWGGHPEIGSLFLIPLFAWVKAINKNNPKSFLIAGMLMGLLLSFAGSAIIVVAAFLLLTPFLTKKIDYWKKVGFMATGLVVGAVPLLIWMIVKGFWASYKLDTWADKEISLNQFVGAPQWARIEIFLSKLMEYNYSFFHNDIHIVLFLSGLIWAGAVGVLNKKRRWYLFFPISIMLLIFAVSIFTLVEDSSVRHYLWVFPVYYVSLALLFADSIELVLPIKLNKYVFYLEKGLRLSLILLIFPAAVTSLQPFLQLDKMGLLMEYRGKNYRNLGMGAVYSRNVHRINCYLDWLNRDDSENLQEIKALKFKPAYREGLRQLFPQVDFERVTKGPREIIVSRIHPNPDFDKLNKEEFYCGIGCGLALKKNFNWHSLEKLPLEKDSASYLRAKECFQSCNSLPCLDEPKRE